MDTPHDKGWGEIPRPWGPKSGSDPTDWARALCRLRPRSTSGPMIPISKVGGLGGGKKKKLRFY